jgi:hypothetical protein
MAYTQSQLDTLEAAIASGVLTVHYGDRTVTYHSLAEMRALRGEMKKEIAAAAGGSNYSLLNTKKGF